MVDTIEEVGMMTTMIIALTAIMMMMMTIMNEEDDEIVPILTERIPDLSTRMFQQSMIKAIEKSNQAYLNKEKHQEIKTGTQSSKITVVAIVMKMKEGKEKILI